MDFEAKTLLGTYMDETERELIVLLGTRIGTLMEDASIVAITLASANPEDCTHQINDVVSAARQISKLANALEAINK